ncbi:MAG: rRNA maturation RNase YbeY, partial [Aquificota bacterium]
DAFTDVLAFPGDGKYLGDVIISVERAKEQAPNFGFTFEKELALLVVHGVLHLLGYRDYTTEEAREMERLQGDILQEVEEKGLI